MHLQPFLYGSAELSDDLLRVRTLNYCSARDDHVSTSLRGEGRRGGRGERGEEEREGEEEEEKGGSNGEGGTGGNSGKKGEGRGRREVTVKS